MQCHLLLMTWGRFYEFENFVDTNFITKMLKDLASKPYFNCNKCTIIFLILNLTELCDMCFICSMSRSKVLCFALNLLSQTSLIFSLINVNVYLKVLKHNLPRGLITAHLHSYICSFAPTVKIQMQSKDCSALY
jgi:hypothetical protein